MSLSALLNFALPKAPNAERVAFLRAQPFAHRGLHGANAVENSRAAFAAAIAVGHGIELDVQMAGNGEPMVFHDERLERLTAETGALADRTGLELAQIKLFGSHETIPRLSEVLDLVAGQVPVLIEIKSNVANVNLICLAVRRALEGYRGDAAVMSFDPRISVWFRTHARRIAHGLVVSERIATKRSDLIRARLEVRLALERAKPDFVAYDLRSLPSPVAEGLRARKVPILTWTVRSAAEEQLGFAHADEIIYERPSQQD